ncbi:uncharacterized protein VTP21DRAFT_4113 [Calcarisporiella thermophila]|uniref:uncharacterized protein n=1 Tax=Calcarisporiella thermophila TaxID=911321 RepID=UPI00374336E7
MKMAVKRNRPYNSQPVPSKLETQWDQVVTPRRSARIQELHERNSNKRTEKVSSELPTPPLSATKESSGELQGGLSSRHRKHSVSTPTPRNKPGKRKRGNKSNYKRVKRAKHEVEGINRVKDEEDSEEGEEEAEMLFRKNGTPAKRAYGQVRKVDKGKRKASSMLLMDLPNEMLLCIIDLLATPSQLFNIGMTCKRLYSLTSIDYYWRPIVFKLHEPSAKHFSYGGRAPDIPDGGYRRFLCDLADSDYCFHCGCRAVMKYELGELGERITQQFKRRYCKGCQKTELINKTNAKERYLVTDKQLQKIQYVEKKWYGKPSYLFLRSAIEALSIERWGTLEAMENEKLNRRPRFHTSRSRFTYFEFGYGFDIWPGFDEDYFYHDGFYSDEEYFSSEYSFNDNDVCPHCGEVHTPGAFEIVDFLAADGSNSSASATVSLSSQNDESDASQSAVGSAPLGITANSANTEGNN